MTLHDKMSIQLQHSFTLIMQIKAQNTDSQTLYTLFMADVNLPTRHAYKTKDGSLIIKTFLFFFFFFFWEDLGIEPNIVLLECIVHVIDELCTLSLTISMPSIFFAFARSFIWKLKLVAYLSLQVVLTQDQLVKLKLVKLNRKVY